MAKSGKDKRKIAGRGGTRKRQRAIHKRFKEGEIVTLPSGMSFLVPHFHAVVDRIDPIKILAAWSPEWRGWKYELGDGRWILYKPGCKYGWFITHEDLLTLLVGSSLLFSLFMDMLDPMEQEFFGNLVEFKRLESTLRMQFWDELRRLAPKTYVRLVRSIMHDAEHKKAIEDIGQHLSNCGLSWRRIKAIEHLEERLLCLARSERQRASDFRESVRKHWRKFDRSVKQICSGEAPYSKSYKAMVLAGHAKAKTLRPFERALLESLEGNLTVAVEKIVGRGTGHESEQKTRSAEVPNIVWNVTIVRLVNELVSAGFSKRRSFKLTDAILHLLCPRLWEEPSKYSTDRVRQRYYYWSDKLQT